MARRCAITFFLAAVLVGVAASTKQTDLVAQKAVTEAEFPETEGKLAETSAEKDEKLAKAKSDINKLKAVHQQLMGQDKGLGEAPEEKTHEVGAKVAELSSQKTDAEAKLAKAKSQCDGQLSSQKAESDTKLEAVTSAYRKYSSTMGHVVFDIKEQTDANPKP